MNIKIKVKYYSGEKKKAIEEITKFIEENWEWIAADVYNGQIDIFLEMW